MLSDRQGGMDWAGLPLVCELLGVTDVETLVRHLITIKFYKKKDSE